MYLLSSFVRQHNKLHRQALKRLTQSPPSALCGGQGGKGGSLRAQSAADDNIIIIVRRISYCIPASQLQRICILLRKPLDFPLITEYLSSWPNKSRSVAFSCERSAIFSALSRSRWKLLWIFLISSLLVENWAWMSAGRYSCKNRSSKAFHEVWIFNQRLLLKAKRPPGLFHKSKNSGV